MSLKAWQNKKMLDYGLLMSYLNSSVPISALWGSRVLDCTGLLFTAIQDFKLQHIIFYRWFNGTNNIYFMTLTELFYYIQNEKSPRTLWRRDLL